jgi:ceramide glucosyltransferase
MAKGFRSNLPMTLLLAFLIVTIFAERLLKHLLVIRFFRRPIPPQTQPITLVSILQPILSGDPTLAAGLEQNLTMQTRYPLEFLWLVDDDDYEAQSICHDLLIRHPEKRAHLILLPPPGPRQNPKMVKLIAGAQRASGDVICVLDDDTRLPAFGLESCLPFLDQPGVGLAFGLPYYVSFGNFWSRMVAYFVNSHSLLAYIPYAMLTEPVTINGMFYAIRREILDKVGGFEGLEGILADDFAIAQRVRSHSYRLAQTPLRHAISTWVAAPRNYFNLIQRWFIFPRESMMRYLKGREQVVFYTAALLPVFFPWLALLLLAISPALWPATLLYFAYDYLVFAHFNLAYLNQASRWSHSYWVTLLALLLPLQILAAQLAPQRIIWRGHVMQAEAGGSFEFVQRRKK